MFSTMQRTWGVRIRAVTAAVAVMALLASAFAAPLEIDHRVLSTQAAAVSVANVGSDDGGRVQLASSTECHAGHSCMPVIMPRLEVQGLEHFDSPLGLPRVRDYLALGVRYRLFHPPRILSQV
ncbi:MAG: hypothetical protein KDK08_11415 [Rhizobiaceae bacterium]|nr:hypothetical protein [Rhizobiaceae bacterium]